MHRLPDGEISLELDVRVGSRKRLWSRDCIDDAMVDHFDDALAAPQILGKGGSRSCCVGPDSHFATGGATSRCLRAEPAAGLCSRGHFSLACKAPPHRAPPRLSLTIGETDRLTRPSSAVDWSGSLPWGWTAPLGGRVALRWIRPTRRRSPCRFREASSITPSPAASSPGRPGA